jgi:hypothetical protein
MDVTSRTNQYRGSMLCNSICPLEALILFEGRFIQVYLCLRGTVLLPQMLLNAFLSLSMILLVKLNPMYLAVRKL